MTLQQIINHIYTNQKTMLHRSAGFSKKKYLPYRMVDILFNAGSGIEKDELKTRCYQKHKGTGACFDGYLSNLRLVLEPTGISVNTYQHPNGKEYVSMAI
mgnify:CR=1 FL=1